MYNLCLLHLLLYPPMWCSLWKFVFPQGFLKPMVWPRLVVEHFVLMELILLVVMLVVQLPIPKWDYEIFQKWTIIIPTHHQKEKFASGVHQQRRVTSETNRKQRKHSIMVGLKVGMSELSIQMVQFKLLIESRTFLSFLKENTYPQKNLNNNISSAISSLKFGSMEPALKIGSLCLQ